VLRIHPEEPEPALLAHVVASLQAGGVVALPTDTFYGLAVDPVNLFAVDRIYDLKSRARHKPLSLLIANMAQAFELARSLDSAFDVLAERFWPGPLTMIVKALRQPARPAGVHLRGLRARAVRRQAAADCRWRPDSTLHADDNCGPERGRQFMDDPARRRHPHPRDRAHAATLAALISDCPLALQLQIGFS
jgi:hypothetical protein